MSSDESGQKSYDLNIINKDVETDQRNMEPVLDQLKEPKRNPK